MQFSEVSVVVNPAYLQTEVSARNAVFDRRALDEYKASLGWKPSMAFRERVIRAGIR
jgi:phage head maturation protease